MTQQIDQKLIIWENLLSSKIVIKIANQIIAYYYYNYVIYTMSKHWVILISVGTESVLCV